MDDRIFFVLWPDGLDGCVSNSPVSHQNGVEATSAMQAPASAPFTRSFSSARCKASIHAPEYFGPHLERWQQACYEPLVDLPNLVALWPDGLDGCVSPALKVHVVVQQPQYRGLPSSHCEAVDIQMLACGTTEKA